MTGADDLACYVAMFMYKSLSYYVGFRFCLFFSQRRKFGIRCLNKSGPINVRKLMIDNDLLLICGFEFFDNETFDYLIHFSLDFVLKYVKQ